MSAPQSVPEKAEKALKIAVRRALEDHKKTGDRVAIWRNGKVVMADPARLLRKSA